MPFHRKHIIGRQGEEGEQQTLQISLSINSICLEACGDEIVAEGERKKEKSMVVSQSAILNKIGIFINLYIYIYIHIYSFLGRSSSNIFLTLLRRNISSTCFLIGKKK